MRTTAFGDDKDRVVVRSNGEPTYLASDLAYMVITSALAASTASSTRWGQTTTAYVRELKAAAAALLGDPPDAIEAPIIQFVHLVEGSAAPRGHVQAKGRVRDARRAARRDRRRRHQVLHAAAPPTTERSTSISDLARSQSAENPVYYVQYAHARIASILRRPSIQSGLRPLLPPAPTGGTGSPGRGGTRSHQEARRPPSRMRSPRRRCGAGRTGSPPTRSSSPRNSRPSTATVAPSSAPSPRPWRASALRCQRSRGASIGTSLGLLGVPARRSRCRSVGPASGASGATLLEKTKA